jgi:NmrA-like family
MTYPEYYDVYDVKDAEKENGVVVDDDFALSEHLRFSTNSYRYSIDENSAALKKYNDYRYSEESNGERTSASRSNRSYRESGGSSLDREPPKHRGSSDNRKYSHGTMNSSAPMNNSKHTARSSEATSAEACEKTIALFGVNGVTGHHFLQLAIEAGYHVRALILPGFELDEMKENPNLTLVRGTMDDQPKIHRVIRKAAYVVCMLNDCPLMFDTIPPTLAPTQSNFDFVQKLIPLMSRCSNCKVLLYQVSLLYERNRRFKLLNIF